MSCTEFIVFSYKIVHRYEITRRIRNDDNEMGRTLAVFPLEVYSLVPVSLVYDEFKFLVNCDAL